MHTYTIKVFSTNRLIGSVLAQDIEQAACATKLVQAWFPELVLEIASETDDDLVLYVGVQ